MTIQENMDTIAAILNLPEHWNDILLTSGELGVAIEDGLDYIVDNIDMIKESVADAFSGMDFGAIDFDVLKTQIEDLIPDLPVNLSIPDVSETMGLDEIKSMIDEFLPDIPDLGLDGVLSKMKDIMTVFGDHSLSATLKKCDSTVPGSPPSGGTAPTPPPDAVDWGAILESALPTLTEDHAQIINDLFKEIMDVADISMITDNLQNVLALLSTEPMPSIQTLMPAVMDAVKDIAGDVQNRARSMIDIVFQKLETLISVFKNVELPDSEFSRLYENATFGKSPSLTGLLCLPMAAPLTLVHKAITGKRPSLSSSPAQADSTALTRNETNLIVGMLRLFEGVGVGLIWELLLETIDRTKIQDKNKQKSSKLARAIFKLARALADQILNAVGKDMFSEESIKGTKNEWDENVWRIGIAIWFLKWLRSFLWPLFFKDIWPSAKELYSWKKGPDFKSSKTTILVFTVIIGYADFIMKFISAIWKSDKNNRQKMDNRSVAAQVIDGVGSILPQIIDLQINREKLPEEFKIVKVIIDSTIKTTYGGLKIGLGVNPPPEVTIGYQPSTGVMTAVVEGNGKYDADYTGYTYQWKKSSRDDGADLEIIDNATNSSHTLSENEKGKYIYVTVNYAFGYINSEACYKAWILSTIIEPESPYKIILTFSDYVFSAGNGDLDESNFNLTISQGDAIILSVGISPSGRTDVCHLTFVLDREPSENQKLTVNPKSDAIYDRYGNALSTEQTNNTVNLII